jgi:hypothetical protein
MQITRLAPLALLVALALPAAAQAGPVATDDSSYQGLGRVFPDPQSQVSCPGGPCSPHRQGNVPATTFLGYQEFIDALTYMNSKPEWQRYLEVWTLDGKLGENDSNDPGTDEHKNFPGDNLGSWEFTPRGRAHSAGLPTTQLGRVKSDLFVLRVTDETVPDAGKKRIALSLSIHGIERAGVEGGTRAMEDLVTAATSKRLTKPILTTKGLPVAVPTFGDVLRKTIIYFTYPNPDGWRRGDVNDHSIDKGPGFFYQRYNGNGVDVNRDWPDIGYAFRPYSALSEPESRGLSGALQDIRTNGGPFSAGDDLHGQLGADSFSFTLLPHGSHDFAKNARIENAAKTINLVQQDVLSWSPQIQPNSAPPGNCVNGPLSQDCQPMYGQSWGTVYDTINYTTTGALGDYFDSSIGLRADGIDNEMSYSHLDKDIVFDPQIEQLHVDGNVGLIYAHVAEVLDPRQAIFTSRGLKGYVPADRVHADERPSSVSAPPGTSPQADIDDTATAPGGDATYEFAVKQDDKTYDGGMRVDITEPNLQGVTPAGVTHSLEVQCKGCDRHPGIKDDEGFVTVARDYNQSGLYAQAGLTAAVNQPQASAGGKAVQWRAVVSGSTGPQVHVHVDFSQGPATNDGETGGGVPPRQAGYDVAGTDFWRRLDGFTSAANAFRTVDPDALATQAGTKVPGDLDTLILSDRALPGYRYPAPAAGDVQADQKFASQQPTAPCGYQDGNPHTPNCSESFPLKINPGQGSVTVAIQPSPQGDLTLTVARKTAGGEEEQGFSDGGSFGQAETVRIDNPIPGDYVIYVDNFAAPDSSFTGTAKFAAPEADNGPSRHGDDDYQRYLGKLRDFVEGGGNLVLTDGALRALPGLFGQIKAGDVTRQTSYVGQVAFTSDAAKTAGAQSATAPGNTLSDPLARNVKQPGARFNTDLRRQTFEPTPIGFSIQNAATGGDESHSPVWQVDRKAFEAAGGRVAATSVTSSPRTATAVDTQVTLGELKLGKGVVRILGALVPQPSEAFDHQEGLEPFAVTYTGYSLAENLTDYCAPGHTCPTVTAAAVASRQACAARSGFAGVKARRSGRGVRFDFDRRAANPVSVEVFQASRGRTVLPNRLIARYRNIGQRLTWSGKATVKGRRASDGLYFARVRMRGPNSRIDTRRITLRRSHGRWSTRPDFYGRESCGLLRSFKLHSPAFGGRRGTALGVAYRVATRTRVSVVVLRGKRVVRRFKTATRRGETTYRLRLPARRLRAGDYRVRVTAGTGKRTVTRTLVARRL